MQLFFGVYSIYKHRWIISLSFYKPTLALATSLTHKMQHMLTSVSIVAQVIAPLPCSAEDPLWNE